MRKKKSKRRRILLWSSLGIAIVLITSLFVLNFAVDKVLNSISGMDTILDEIEAVDSTGASSMNGNASDDGGTPHSTDVVDSSDSTQGTTSQSTPGNNTTEDQSAPNTEPSKTENATDSPDLNYKAEISTDKAKEIEETASLTEKAKVASLLLSNLSTDDIKLLSDLASGGLNLEEKKEARALILKKLSEEEYNKLISIAQKYGLSQGKSYSEVIKEE